MHFSTILRLTPILGFTLAHHDDGYYHAIQALESYYPEAFNEVGGYYQHQARGLDLDDNDYYYTFQRRDADDLDYLYHYARDMYSDDYDYDTALVSAYLQRRKNGETRRKIGNMAHNAANKIKNAFGRGGGGGGRPSTSRPGSPGAVESGGRPVGELGGKPVSELGGKPVSELPAGGRPARTPSSSTQSSGGAPLN